MFKYPVDPELESYLMSRTDAEEVIGLAHNMLVELYEHCEINYICNAFSDKEQHVKFMNRIVRTMKLLREAADEMRPGFTENCVKNKQENEISAIMHY